jgi:hypothetical protein
MISAVLEIRVYIVLVYDTLPPTVHEVCPEIKIANHLADNLRREGARKIIVVPREVSITMTIGKGDMK